MNAEVEVGGRFYRVAGVLKGREEGYGSPVQVQADKSVFVPAVTAWRVAQRPVSRASSPAPRRASTTRTRSRPSRPGSANARPGSSSK